MIKCCRNNDDSEPSAKKRRCVNGASGNNLKDVASDENLPSAGANDAGPSRITRSAVTHHAEPALSLSRPLANDALGGRRVLPSMAVSRSGSLQLRRHTRSKSANQPRSLDVTCTFSSRGNTSINKTTASGATAGAGRLHLTMPETPAVLKYEFHCTESVETFFI